MNTAELIRSNAAFQKVAHLSALAGMLDLSQDGELETWQRLMDGARSAHEHMKRIDAAAAERAADDERRRRQQDDEDSALLAEFEAATRGDYPDYHRR